MSNSTTFYDSTGHIFALCLFAAISPLVMMTTPVLAHELATGWNLSPSQVGTFFFYEQIYMGVAAIPAIWWSKRFSAQACMKFFILLFLLGNGLSFFASNLTLLILARSSAAFAAGSILIITMASASMTSKPARTFALWLLGQTIFGALAILVLPKLFATYGLHAFFFMLDVLMLLAIPFYRKFSAEVQKNNTQHSSSTSVANTSIIWKVIGVLAVLVFFTSISSVWTFLTSIGLQSNITENVINGYLSLATVCGILGCFIATLIGHKANRLIVIPFGFVLFFISLSLLFGNVSILSFMSSVLLFKFAWMFTFPFILGSLASIDHNGGIMKFTSMVIGTGMAIGPAVSGHIIENSTGFSNLLFCAVGLFLSSLILISLLNKKHQALPSEELKVFVK